MGIEYAIVFLLVMGSITFVFGAVELVIGYDDTTENPTAWKITILGLIILVIGTLLNYLP